MKITIVTKLKYNMLLTFQMLMMWCILQQRPQEVVEAPEERPEEATPTQPTGRVTMVTTLGALMMLANTHVILVQNSLTVTDS